MRKSPQIIKPREGHLERHATDHGAVSTEHYKGVNGLEKVVLREVRGCSAEGIEKKTVKLQGSEKAVVARHEAGHAVVGTAVANLLPGQPWVEWEYVKWMINQVYESKRAETLRDKVTSSLTSLFEQYHTGIYPQSNLRSNGTRTMNVSMSPVVGADIMTAMYLSQMGQEYLEEKSEFDKYLEERCERYNADFDILNWWKVNSSRYPILSSIARDIWPYPSQL